MTLIVGVKCKDGVVLGADGAATYGAQGQFTITQPTKKLEIKNGRIIVGVSGPVGLGQRIMAVIDQLDGDKGFLSSQSTSQPRRPEEVMVAVREKLAPHLLQELQICAQAAPAIGPMAAQISAVSQTLVAAPVQGKPCLFQFDQQGAPEMATDQLPFVAIGSGQRSADPFLAFIRRIFWRPEEVPSLSDGIFAVLWTLQHAIATAPGGVAEPIQIVVLQERTARELKDELNEHKQNIKAAEDALRNFKNLIPSGDQGSAALPPVP